MSYTEHIIIARGLCVIRTQPIEEILDQSRMMFRALGPCPMRGEPDTRAGIECELRQHATVFSRWHIALPNKRVLVTREMMNI